MKVYMSESTITIIIIACTCLLYLTEKFSVAVTNVMGMLALVFTDILDFNEAFSCFANTNVMLVLGMIIIVNALIECGVAGKIGNLLSRFVGLIGVATAWTAIVVFYRLL